MYFQKRLFIIFILLIQNVAYADAKRVYWMPHLNRVSLYEEKADKAERVSVPWSHGLLYTFHYQFSEKLATTFMVHQFPDDKRPNIGVYTAWGWNGVVKYSPPFLKGHLFTRKLQGYAQSGAWYADVLEKKRDLALKTRHHNIKGAGWIGGFGAYCEVSPRILLDIGWKGLIRLPVLKDDLHTTPMTSTHMVTLGLGFLLW